MIHVSYKVPIIYLNMKFNVQAYILVSILKITVMFSSTNTA